MGLTFTVGNPSSVFSQPYAERIRGMLSSQFGDGLVLDATERPYYSKELDWSGWRLLQARAIEEIGTSQALHLLSMEAWCGCYVSAETKPFSLKFDEKSSPLRVASLLQLVSELNTFAATLGLPIEEPGLRELTTKYGKHDLWDKDLDLQTYAELYLATEMAHRRRQALWVVK